MFIDKQPICQTKQELEAAMKLLDNCLSSRGEMQAKNNPTTAEHMDALTIPVYHLNGLDIDISEDISFKSSSKGEAFPAPLSKCTTQQLH